MSFVHAIVSIFDANIKQPTTFYSPILHVGTFKRFHYTVSKTFASIVSELCSIWLTLPLISFHVSPLLPCILSVRDSFHEEILFQIAIFLPMFTSFLCIKCVRLWVSFVTCHRGDLWLPHGVVILSSTGVINALTCPFISNPQHFVMLFWPFSNKIPNLTLISEPIILSVEVFLSICRCRL